MRKVETMNDDDDAIDDHSYNLDVYATMTTMAMIIRLP